MKKILSLTLALMMLILCVIPAFANDTQIYTENGPNGQGAFYQLAYPADTTIEWEADTTDIGAVEATILWIEPASIVEVTVESANGYKLINTADSARTIAYTLVGADSMVFAPGEVGKSFPLSVEIVAEQWLKAAAGEHNDTLTFTAEYKI